MRVLIANPFGIGDVLFSRPLLLSLRRADPGGFIGYLCNRRTGELVEGCFPVDWRGVFEKDEFRAAWRRSRREALVQLVNLKREVTQRRFDLLVDLSMGWHYALGGLLSGIPRRIGFHFRGRGRFLTDRLSIEGFHDQPVSRYYLDLLSFLFREFPSWAVPECPPLGFPEPLREQVDGFLRSNGLNGTVPIAGIVPGGGASWGPYAAYKQWPADRFAQAARHLSGRHRMKILLIGDAQEAPLCRAVADRLDSPPVLAIQVPSLLFLGELMKRCALALGNDSGPMHLAAHAGVRTVTIFGPVDGSVYGPTPEQGPGNRIVSKALACRPCYRSFRIPPCPWNIACLKQLEIAPVLKAVDEILKN